MAVGLVATAAVEHAAAYPTAGSVTINATGANVLLALIYSNATWAGPDPAVTFNGTALTKLARYDSTASGYQTVFAYVLADPAQASASLSYSQSSGTYNSERHVVAFALSGASSAITDYAGVTRAANVATMTTALPAVSAGALTVAAGFAYYLSGAPTITGGTADRTERAALTTGSAAKSRVYSSAASGSVSFTWTSDSYNYAAGFILAVPPSGGAPPPAGPTVRWVYFTDGTQKPVTMKVWNGTALEDPSSYTKT